LNNRALLRRLLASQANVRFDDLLSLVEAFGFRERRRRGSHRMFSHPIVGEQLNLQEFHGEAKPYQIRQFLKIVERYNLHLGDEP